MSLEEAALDFLQDVVKIDLYIFFLYSYSENY